jgi:hypothetical protein
MAQYNKEYFLNKFKAIPDEQWICNGDLQHEDKKNVGCALYHCGVREDVNHMDYVPTEEALALATLLSKDKHLPKDDYFQIVYRINDGAGMRDMTPKQAIINALQEL